MQVSKKTLGKWRDLRDQGDNKKIAELTGLTETSIARILTGKQETSAEILMKIKEFHEKKRRLRAAIEK